MRRVEQQDAALRRDGGLQIVSGEAKAVFRAQRHTDTVRARHCDHALIGGVEWITDQDAVAGAGQAHQRGEQGGLRAGKAQDVAGIDIAAPPGIAGGKRVQQVALAAPGGIAGAPRRHGGMALLDHARVGRLVRLADGQFDDVGSGGLHVAAALVHGPFDAAGMGETVGDRGVMHHAAPRRSAGSMPRRAATPSSARRTMSSREKSSPASEISSHSPSIRAFRAIA